MLAHDTSGCAAKSGALITGVVPDDADQFMRPSSAFFSYTISYQRAYELTFIQGYKIDQHRINSITCRERITF